jgi:heme-degrading monooxygenase HmoA
MFCVIYKFTVKPSHEDHFRQHWLAVTKHLYEHAGSLGSRLHRTPTGEYIGYAQWPSRHVWAQQQYMSDVELQAHRQAMRKRCESIEVVYQLNVTDDWLQQEVCGGRS